MSDRSGDHAIVLGGSIAGCWPHACWPTPTTRSRWWTATSFCPQQPRRGTPQGRHIHALLARGQQILEQLFPGFTAELAGHGAPTGDVLGDARLLFGGHRLARTESGLVAGVPAGRSSRTGFGRGLRPGRKWICAAERRGGLTVLARRPTRHRGPSAAPR